MWEPGAGPGVAGEASAIVQLMIMIVMMKLMMMMIDDHELNNDGKDGYHIALTYWNPPVQASNNDDEGDYDW